MLYRKVLNNDELIRRCCFYWMKYKGSLVFFPKDQFVKKANQIFLLGFCEEIVGAWTNLEDEDSQKLLKKGLLHANANINKKFFLLYQLRPYLHQKNLHLTSCLLTVFCRYMKMLAASMLFKSFCDICHFLRVILRSHIFCLFVTAIDWVQFCYMVPISKMKIVAHAIFCWNSNLQKTPMRDDNSPNGQVYG